VLSKQSWRDDNAAERQELSRRDGEKRRSRIVAFKGN
jgi:hypothetical protein